MHENLYMCNLRPITEFELPKFELNKFEPHLNELTELASYESEPI